VVFIVWLPRALLAKVKLAPLTADIVPVKVPLWACRLSSRTVLAVMLCR